MKPLVLFHRSCWDGFAAAWTVRKAFAKRGTDIEAVSVNYGEPAPDVTGRTVYVVDFSYQQDALIEMFKSADDLIIFDHHKSAKPELDALKAYVDAYDDATMPLARPIIEFDVNRSGARITWDRLIGGKAPWLIDYTEDRDLWRHALPDTWEVNAALRSYPLDFELWDKLDRDAHVEQLAVEGAAIRRREQQIVADHLKNIRTLSHEGLEWAYVNATVLYSEIAGELAKLAPVGACFFDRADGKRQWSLRSKNDGPDVSEIAKLFGGGGHAHAAGFERPFNRIGFYEETK